MAAVNPGEVEIKTISLHTPKGTLNATELTLSFDVYESVFMPGIIAELIIRDDGSLANYLPLVGEEKVNIEFATPGRGTAKYELIVVELKDGETEKNLRTKNYILRCTSPEVYVHKTSIIQKSYNTNISDMIKDICTKYLKTKKSVDVEDTKGIQPIIVPSLKPYEAIDMLRRRSVSDSNKSSTYLFFENQKGLNFKTIEKMFSEGDVGDRVFTNDHTPKTDYTQTGYRNVLSFNQPKQYDSASKLGGGGLNVQTKVLDFKDLSYKKNDNKNTDNAKFKSADGKFNPTNSSEFNDQFSKTAGLHTMMPTDGSKPKTFIPDSTADQKSFVSQLAQGALHLQVMGDSEITAGILIQSNLTGPSSANQPGEDTLLAGKYLVASVRHIIGVEGKKPRYTCAIEALKGGYKESPV
jgi:hypothetical protein